MPPPVIRRLPPADVPPERAQRWRDMAIQIFGEIAPGSPPWGRLYIRDPDRTAAADPRPWTLASLGPMESAGWPTVGNA